MWVLFNEPGGVNAYSKEWQSGGFTYYEMFFNTSKAIKKHSKKITFGGLSDSPSQAAILMNLTKEVPEREGAFDIFTCERYSVLPDPPLSSRDLVVRRTLGFGGDSDHAYCNGHTPTSCAAMQVETVRSLRSVLPQGMPIYLEETGSTAGPYVPFHDTTGEAAFVVPYVAAMAEANLAGAHWWCASDLYTEHGSITNYTWIPHEDYSGGMPRAEFTGRWGFTTPSGVAKPIHRAFQLLRAAGDTRLAVTAEAGGTCGDTVDVLALKNNATGGNASTMVFVSNSGKGVCNVTLAGLKARTAQLHRIAPGHSDPNGLWESWGSPPFPTPAQVAKLKEESELKATAVGLDGLVMQVEPNALHVLVL